VLLFPPGEPRILASFPREPGQAPGMNRCLVWNRRASETERDATFRPMTEDELVELLGPADEDTVLLRVARIDWS
jgi:hypothetical protein